MRPWALVAALLVATSAVASLNWLQIGAEAPLDDPADEWQRPGALDHAPLQDYEGEEEEEQEQDQDQGPSMSTFRQDVAPPCGQTHAMDGGATRIVNGENETHGEFPSFVSLQSNRNRIVCGGTLISARHVLTAAHCLNGTGSAAGFHALLGSHEPHLYQLADRVAVKGAACVSAGHVVKKSDTPDWAVLELEREADISQQYVRAACLPFGNAPRIRNEDTDCWAVGAGTSDFLTTVDGTLVDAKPRQVQKLRVREKGCAWEMNITLHRTQFCYGALEPSHRGGPCSGDSGGPVLCRDVDPDRWTLAAVANGIWANRQCNKNLNRSIPAIYTDLWSILDDIRRECAWMGVP